MIFSVNKASVNQDSLRNYKIHFDNANNKNGNFQVQIFNQKKIDNNCSIEKK